MFRPAVLLLLCLTSCGGRLGMLRADGSYAIDCTDRKACLERAKRTCGEEGYIVVGGKNKKKRYGAPGNEVYIGKDELHIRCNRDRPSDAPDPHVGDWALRRPDEPAAKSGQATPKPLTVAPSPRAPVCRPGETQRCFGPGACEGGQSCLPDGSAFGVCDCGDAKSGGKANEQPAVESPDSGVH